MRRHTLDLVAALAAAVALWNIPDALAKAGNCPAGQRWSYLHKVCKSICPPGHRQDPTTGVCKEVRDQCPAGMYWSRNKGKCLHRCRAGTTWNDTKSKCERVQTNCGPGWRFSKYYNRCVQLHSNVINCPRGTSWNGFQCEAWRRCPPGSYFSAYYNECRTRVRNCPYGYRYRPGWGCQPICPTGWYFSGGNCQKVARKCSSNMFYSYALRRCVRRCGARYYWDYRRRRCVSRTW